MVNRRVGRSSIVAWIVLTLCWILSCEKGVEHQGRIGRYERNDFTYDVTIHMNGSWDQESVQFYADDEQLTPSEIDTSDPYRTRIHFLITKRLKNYQSGERKPPFQLESSVLLPCGWKRVPLEIGDVLHTSDPSRKVIEAHFRGGFALVTNIWVDNRGGTETHLTMGEMKYPIPADSAGTVKVYIPECEEGRIMRLNSTKIGSLPIESHRDMLVDVSGNHCYEMKEVYYAPIGSDPRFGPPRKLGSMRIIRRQFHELPFVSYFLKEAPSTKKGGSGFDWQLNDMKCP